MVSLRVKIFRVRNPPAQLRADQLKVGENPYSLKGNNIVGRRSQSESNRIDPFLAVF